MVTTTEYIVKNESELYTALASDDCETVKVEDRVRLSKPLVLKERENITFVGTDGAAFEYLESVDGFYEIMLGGKTVWTAELPENVAVKHPYNAYTADGMPLKRLRLPKIGF